MRVLKVEAVTPVSALAGLAPFVRKSGKWTGKAKIGRGRAGLRQALYMPALVAARCNPQLCCVYKTLRSHGKEAKVALVANMRKLLILANILICEDREGEVDIFVIKLTVNMIPVTIDQFRETSCLVHTLKDEITIFRFATLKDWHVFARHHEIRAASKCCEKAIQSLGVGYGAANNAGQKAIQLGIFGIGKLRVQVHLGSLAILVQATVTAVSSKRNAVIDSGWRS